MSAFKIVSALFVTKFFKRGQVQLTIFTFDSGDVRGLLPV